MVGAGAALGPARLAREHDEAGGVVGFILDVLRKDVESIDLGRKAGGDGGAGLVADFGDLARRSRSVGGNDRLDAELADHLAALAERMHMAFDRLDVFDRCALGREQLMPHRHEMLGDDVQLGIRHQMMDVGDAAGH